MKKYLAYFIFSVCALYLSILVIREFYYPKSVITINGYSLTVEQALTPRQQTKGLSIKKTLSENHGMVFVYNHDDYLSFWMKGMNFPIDIIWLDNQCRVVHIEENLPPCPLTGDCPTYTPTQRARYVLETIAGFTKRYQVEQGKTIIEWPAYCG